MAPADSVARLRKALIDRAEREEALVTQADPLDRQGDGTH